MAVLPLLGLDRAPSRTARDQLTAEQQAEILASLAQSNPALGNLGSTSQVLESQDLERLTLRDLRWLSGFQLDPISPTLAVVLYPRKLLEGFVIWEDCPYFWGLPGLLSWT